MGARARRAGAVAARHVPFPRRAPEPDHRGRCRSPPNYAPDQSVQRTRPRSACRPPSPWLQNRALCMHAALSQSQTQTRLNAALAPRPARMAVALACTGRRRGNPVAGSGLLRHRFCPSRRPRATFLFSSFCHDNDRRHRDVCPWPPAWMRELTHQPLPRARRHGYSAKPRNVAGITSTCSGSAIADTHP